MSAYVSCTVCQKSKAPRGRSVPMASGGCYCTSDCRGYYLDPRPSSHWPGEDCHFEIRCGLCLAKGEESSEIAAIREERNELREEVEELEDKILELKRVAQGGSVQHLGTGVLDFGRGGTGE